MNCVAIKMLTGDRTKYLGLIFAIAFASFLLENQSSIFAGVVGRTASQILDVTDADMSRELYVRGLADFLTVLDNQRSLYVAQDQRVQSERTLIVSLIALYKALGGGWETWEIQP